MKEKAVSLAVIVIVIIIIVVFIGVAAYVVLDSGQNDGSSSDETFDALTECTGIYIKDFAPIFDNLCYLLRKLDAPAEIITPTTGWDHYAPVTGDFGFRADLDGDLWLETTVSGTIKGGMDTNISDGIQVNEVMRADWTMKEEQVEKGNGAFSFVKLSWDSYRMTIVSKTTFNRQESCEFEFTSFGLHLNIDEIESGNPFAGVFTGVIEFATLKNSDTLEGMMTFDGSDIATVSGTYKGAAYNFNINLETFEISA